MLLQRNSMSNDIEESMESRCFRNPFDIPIGSAAPSNAMLKAGRRLNAARVQRQLAVCVHQNVMPFLSSRESLRESSVYVGTPGIAFAFAKLSTMSPNLLSAIGMDRVRCLTIAQQLLDETGRGCEHAVRSLMLVTPRCFAMRLGSV